MKNLELEQQNPQVMKLLEDNEKIRQELKRTREENEKLKYIISYGNISTLETLIDQYMDYSRVHLKRIAMEIHMTDYEKGSTEKVLELIEHLEYVENELHQLIAMKDKGRNISMLEDLMKRNEEKEKIPLSGDLLYPESLIKQNESVQKIWNERIGNIEDVINGNMTVYDAVIREQKRQKAIHQSAKETAQSAQQTIKIDNQNLEDAQKAFDASNKAEGQQQVLQAGNYLLYDILQSVLAGNRARAHMATSMAAYFDSKVQEQAESERILKNSTNISKKWVENSK